MRDASIAGLAVVLVAIAALASDAGPVAVPAAAALAAAYVAFHLVVVLPSLRACSTARVAASLALAAPFAWALELAAPVGLAWPVAPLAVAALGSLLSSRAGARVRTVVGAAFALALAAGPLAEGLSLGPAPAAMRLPLSALPPRDADGPAPAAPRRESAPSAELVRAGALVPAATAATLGLSRRVVDAPWTNAPAGVPGGVPAGAISVRVVGGAAGRRTEGRFVLVASPDVPRDARDLDACDVVLLLEPLGRDRVAARTLEAFARRGGLLAGPAAPASFGAELERALGTALPEDDGPRGVRALGAGHVARVARAGGLEELATAGFVEPRYATVFDRALGPPEGARSANDADADAAPPRRLPATSLALLAGVALVAIVASRASGARGLVAIAALSALAVLGLGLLAPRDEAAATGEAFVLDLGGAGGRRVEALRVTAGPLGWRWTEPARSREGVRVLGFTTVSTPAGEALELRPGRVAWIVTEARSTGDTTGLASVANAPEWSIPLLRRGGGRPADARLFVGSEPFRGLVPRGVGGGAEANLLVVLPGRP